MSDQQTVGRNDVRRTKKLLYSLFYYLRLEPQGSRRPRAHPIKAPGSQGENDGMNCSRHEKRCRTRIKVEADKCASH